MLIISKQFKFKEWNHLNLYLAICSIEIVLIYLSNIIYIFYRNYLSSVSKNVC